MPVAEAEAQAEARGGSAGQSILIELLRNRDLDVNTPRTRKAGNTVAHLLIRLGPLYNRLTLAVLKTADKSVRNASGYTLADFVQKYIDKQYQHLYTV